MTSRSILRRGWWRDLAEEGNEFALRWYGALRSYPRPRPLVLKAAYSDSLRGGILEAVLLDAANATAAAPDRVHPGPEWRASLRHRTPRHAPADSDRCITALSRVDRWMAC